MKTVIVLIAVVFVILLGLGIWNTLTRESLEEKICDNQAFSLGALDRSLTAASRLVSSNKAGQYDPVLKEAFFHTYNEVHLGIIARQAELKKEYC